MLFDFPVQVREVFIIPSSTATDQEGHSIPGRWNRFFPPEEKPHLKPGDGPCPAHSPDYKKESRKFNPTDTPSLVFSCVIWICTCKLECSGTAAVTLIFLWRFRLQSLSSKHCSGHSSDPFPTELGWCLDATEAQNEIAVISARPGFHPSFKGISFSAGKISTLQFPEAEPQIPLLLPRSRSRTPWAPLRQQLSRLPWEDTGVCLQEIPISPAHLPAPESQFVKIFKLLRIDTPCGLTKTWHPSGPAHRCPLLAFPTPHWMEHSPGTGRSTAGAMAKSRAQQRTTGSKGWGAQHRNLQQSHEGTALGSSSGHDSPPALVFKESGH